MLVIRWMEKINNFWSETKSSQMKIKRDSGVSKKAEGDLSIEGFVETVRDGMPANSIQDGSIDS